MTTGTLQERMMTISRYFTREKWKNETGIFQYPRGKRRTDAVVEALEIAFEPTEFELKKELNLRGDDVVGNVYIVCALDKLFIKRVDNRNLYHKNARG